MFDLSGKNCVYVGGFSGVGYQVCCNLIKKMISHLFVCGRVENVEKLHKLQAESSTVKVHFVHMDIMDRHSIANAVKQVVGICNYVGVLVNGAGVLADKDVDTTIGVNLTGLIHTTMAFLPYMDTSVSGRGGLVVNISSVFGLEPAPAFAVYAAAKHGVVGFTRSLADDYYYRKTGVAFICICPGLTSTELMVNLREHVTWEHHSEELAEVIAKSKHQTPAECAVNVISAMENMKNGSVYICNLGQLKEIVPTKYWHF